MCNTDSKTGVYACVEPEVAAELPMVALRFLVSDDNKLVPTHLVTGDVSYEVTHSTFREGINNVCQAAQEAVTTAQESILAMKAAHIKAASLLKKVYPEYNDALDWTDNFQAYLNKMKA